MMESVLDLEEIVKSENPEERIMEFLNSTFEVYTAGWTNQ
jgi:hypothetical protein